MGTVHIICNQKHIKKKDIKINKYKKQSDFVKFLLVNRICEGVRIGHLWNSYSKHSKYSIEQHIGSITANCCQPLLPLSIYHS